MKNKKKRSLLSKIFMQFLLRELIIMIIVALILGVTSWIILKSDFNWLYNINYDTYSKAIELFNVVFNGFTPFLIIFLIWLILSIINIYLTLKKVFSYMNTIILSVDKLYDKNVEYINLPAELDNVEKKLNHLKSESEKNERLAKESEEKKDNLIVYLAHDIKTPLTSMIGYLSLLDEIDDMPLKQRKKYTSVALNKSYKLEELINELFDIARFNSEHIILEKEELMGGYRFVLDSNPKINITTNSSGEVMHKETEYFDIKINYLYKAEIDEDEKEIWVTMED